jgi:uncharacterized protein DUF1176
MVGFAAALTAIVFSVTAQARPLPGVQTRADRAAWHSLVRWPASCERSWAKTGASGAGIQTWPAGHRVRLVAVRCFVGAYQAVSMLYLLPAHGTSGSALRFRIYVDPGSGVPRVHSTTAVLGVLSFDPRSGRLTVLDKARGVGDCGIYSVFGLRARAFVPLEARAKTACDGGPPFDPARWPKLPLP